MGVWSVRRRFIRRPLAALAVLATAGAVAAGCGGGGQQSGQGLDAFGAKWFVVAPSGNQVT